MIGTYAHEEFVHWYTGIISGGYLPIRLLPFSTSYATNRTAAATLSTTTATTAVITINIIVAYSNAISIAAASAIIVVIVESKGACAVERQAPYGQYWLRYFSKDIHEFINTW